MGTVLVGAVDCGWLEFVSVVVSVVGVLDEEDLDLIITLIVA